MAYCAVREWGVSIVTNTPETPTQKASVVLLVDDFGKYYRYVFIFQYYFSFILYLFSIDYFFFLSISYSSRFSRSICSKQHPTKDLGARVKALRRWFVHFPKKKERKEQTSFFLEVKPVCYLSLLFLC